MRYKSPNSGWLGRAWPERCRFSYPRPCSGPSWSHKPARRCVCPVRNALECIEAAIDKPAHSSCRCRCFRRSRIFGPTAQCAAQCNPTGAINGIAQQCPSIHSVPCLFRKITWLVTHPFAVESASVMLYCADAADVITTKHVSVEKTHRGKQSGNSG